MLRRRNKMGLMTSGDQEALYNSIKSVMPEFVTISFSNPPSDADVVSSSEIITSGLRLEQMNTGIQDYIIGKFVYDFFNLYKDHALDIYLHKNSLRINYDIETNNYSLVIRIAIRHAMQSFEKQVEYEFRSQGVEWIDG